jgi:hypothetical protein
MTRHRRNLSHIARRYGRTVMSARSGHLKLVDPKGRLPAITCASTPSCPHALKNVERDCKRAAG